MNKIKSEVKKELKGEVDGFALLRSDKIIDLTIKKRDEWWIKKFRLFKLKVITNDDEANDNWFNYVESEFDKLIKEVQQHK